MNPVGELFSSVRARWMRRVIAVVARGGRSSVAVVILLGAAAVRAGDFVVVSAEAIPQYQRPESRDGKTAPQTYAFTPGRHFGANLADKSDDQTTFRAIAESLAGALANQSFVPAKPPSSAELLIVVHWGMTEVYEDPNRELQIEQRNAALSDYQAGADAAGNNDPGRYNEIARDMNGSASLQQSLMERNADLLGYTRSLRRWQHRMYPSEEEITMRHEANEERYFIILMAYDYARLRKEKKQHLLWTTHMSVRAAGTNFRIALPQLTAAAEQYFGRDVDEAIHLETKEKKPDVHVGEATVVPEPARK